MISRPYLIAEIGINHNGSIDIVKKLIDNAKKADFDAVKFQKRTIEKVYSKEALDVKRDSPWGTTNREQKNGLEFDLKQYQEIQKYCQKIKIDWSASAWDTESLEFLDRFDIKFHKIASAMIIDTNFLKRVAEKKKHTFISTGMSTEENIDNAVKIFNQKKCSFELMHCISTYPMFDADANLNCIDTLRNTFNCKVGYSGHETGLVVSYAAAAKNITSLERHITLDRAMYGSDQSASLEPNGLKQLVSGVRKIESSLGDGKKTVLKEEVPISKKLRAHLAFKY